MYPPLLSRFSIYKHLYVYYIYAYVNICIYIHTYQLAINHLYFSMWSVD